MDPLTHGLAGTLVASFSGQEFAISNPAVVASILGSLAPDADILFQLKGDMVYLKHHRGFSHSVAGMLVGAFLLTAFLQFFLAGSSWSIFFWSLMGITSHIVMDLFNSYGVQLLWPFSKKRFGIGLLIIFDPILAGIMGLSLICYRLGWLYRSFTLLMLAGYLSFRWWTSRKIYRILLKRYCSGDVKILVTPSLASLWSWHFLVETRAKVMVGEVNFFSWATKIKRRFKKQMHHPVVLAAMNSKLGKVFQDFTPNFHVFYRRMRNGYLVKFVDLRYLLKEEFLHTATGILDQDHQLKQGVFHPYSKERKVKIPG